MKNLRQFIAVTIIVFAAMVLVTTTTHAREVKAISARQIGDLDIPIPDPETQTLVVDFLDRETTRIDQLIEKRQSFLAESNEGYKLISRGDIVIDTMWAWMGAMRSAMMKA